MTDTDHYTAGVGAGLEMAAAECDRLSHIPDVGTYEGFYRNAAAAIRALSPAPAQGWRVIEQDALRYRWLRARDVDTISNGGVFAGKTPENLVLNGDDLDRHIDEAIVEYAMMPPAPLRGEGGE